MAKDPVNVLVITRAQRRLQIRNEDIHPPEGNMAEIAALRQQVRGMGASIDKYDGTTNVEEWFFEFENLAAHQGLNENAEKARLLSFNITGEAKRRFHKLNNEQKASYETIKTNFTNWFSTSRGDRQRLKRQFYQRKQLAYESLRDFILQADAASTHLGLDEEDVLSTIIDNARPAARRALLGHNFATVEDLLKSQLIHEDFEEGDLSAPAVQAIMAEIKKLSIQKDQAQVRFVEKRQSMTYHKNSDRSREHSRDKSKDRSKSGERRRPWYNPGHPEACSKCGIVYCKGDFRCYARNKECHACSKIGHIKSLCRSKPSKE